MNIIQISGLARKVVLRSGSYASGEILVEYPDGTTGALGETGTAVSVSGACGTAIDTSAASGPYYLTTGVVQVLNDSVNPVLQSDIPKSGRPVYLVGTGDAQRVSVSGGMGGLLLSCRPWELSEGGEYVAVHVCPE